MSRGLLKLAIQGIYYGLGPFTKKSGNIFRVGIFLDFVRLTTRTMHPHGVYVRGAKRNRVDRHRGVIERLPLQACASSSSWAPRATASAKSGDIFLVGIVLDFV